VEAIRQVVYVSVAPRRLRDAELLEILELSRANNSRQAVTGMLLYSGTCFIQVLEGTPAVVERLLRRIRRDRRHRGFMVLLDHLVPRRSFSDPLHCQIVSETELDRIAGLYSWSTEMPNRRKTDAGLQLVDFGSRMVSNH